METKICKCCGEEKPIESFTSNRFGISSTCKDCVRKKKAERKQNNNIIEELKRQVLNARNLKLSEFSANELMYELKHRGYTGNLVFVKRIDINIDNIENPNKKED